MDFITWLLICYLFWIAVGEIDRDARRREYGPRTRKKL